MPVTAIYASRILTPQEELLDAVILVEGGRITAIGHRDQVKIPEGAVDYVASGMTVVPGFVDVHIHGAGGHDVNGSDSCRARLHNLHRCAPWHHVDPRDNRYRSGRRNMQEP